MQFKKYIILNEQIYNLVINRKIVINIMQYKAITEAIIYIK